MTYKIFVVEFIVKMSEIINRMTYLEQQLAQFKSIVADGSENSNNSCQKNKNDKISEISTEKETTCNASSKSTDTLLSNALKPNTIPKKDCDVSKPQGQIVKKSRMIDQNIEKTCFEESDRDSFYDNTNSWYIDECPSNTMTNKRRSDTVVRRSNKDKAAMDDETEKKRTLADYWKPVDELEWAKNLFLVGDGFWNSFLKYPKIRRTVTKIEKMYNGRGKCGNFRLFVRKENEMIEGLFDNLRCKLLFALPPKIKIVCISIGTQDILNIKLRYVTGKDNPLKMLNNQKDNIPETSIDLNLMLEGLMTSVKNMVLKLHEMNKAVLLLVPYSNENLKLFDMWQDKIKELTTSLPFPLFRILNLSDVMKSTRMEFESPQEMFESWLPDKEGNPFSLSEYGCIRLFHALEESIGASNQNHTKNIDT